MKSKKKIYQWKMLNHFWILDSKTLKEETLNIGVQVDQMTKRIMRKAIMFKMATWVNWTKHQIILSNKNKIKTQIKWIKYTRGIFSLNKNKKEEIKLS